MNQTSFLLSDVSSKKALIGETKGVLSPETSSADGEGFFAQLAQLVSGDGEGAVEVSAETLVSGEAMASEEAISDALLKSVAASGEGEEVLLDSELPELQQLDGENVASDGVNVTDLDSESQDALLAQTVKQGGGDTVQPERQHLAKQDGEALLQRLNEANAVLQPAEQPVLLSDEKMALQSDAAPIVAGKELPLTQSDDLHAAINVNAGTPDNPDTEKVMLAQQHVDAVSEKLGVAPETLKTLSDAELVGLLKKAQSTSPDEAITEDALALAVAIQRSGVKPEELMSDAPKMTRRIVAQDASESDNAARIPTLASAAALNAMQPQASLVEGEVTPEMLAKAGVNPEWQGKPVQEAMMRMQQAAQIVAPTMAEGDAQATLNDMAARGLAPQTTMNQTASAVQAAVNPQAQASTPLSAFTAIPWTPANMQADPSQPQSVSSGALLEATAAKTLSETGKAGKEVKAEHLAQQLASSLGNQSSTTAAKLDNAVAQTPLQMSQNQAEAANALSERVNMMLSKNLKHVDIRLDPPEMGRMQIKLSMNQDQATVQFTVANTQARDLVEQSMPRLREMLQQQGLQLAQSSVQQQDAGGRQAFAGNQAQGNEQGGQSGQQGGHRSGRNDLEQDTDLNGINRDVYVNASKDRVDYYA
ncbi:flagellar hook-length control protein FliK [Enterovibrio norvegicus]|uniref:Flagellar hook-length control protein FliK n=1 Tax=Enterovibrio norvegicus DSM 15893 TaxID=1121869 RepID=A0A1I5N3W9_9GAMM|nr:flagellar hook-length control protein FliK [Enterovibrio norvegicus]SFP16292.1 flagellar hook-length control protein FliK [Enterovibrio norvegicus DSM 15893]